MANPKIMEEKKCCENKDCEKCKDKKCCCCCCGNWFSKWPKSKIVFLTVLAVIIIICAILLDISSSYRRHKWYDQNFMSGNYEMKRENRVSDSVTIRVLPPGQKLNAEAPTTTQ